MKPSFLAVTPSPIGQWEVGDIAIIDGERLLVVAVTGNGLMVIPERSDASFGRSFVPVILLVDLLFWVAVGVVAWWFLR